MHINSQFAGLSTGGSTPLERSSRNEKNEDLHLVDVNNKGNQIYIGFSTDKEYDSNGNVVKETQYKDGNVHGYTEYEYDENGRNTTRISKDKNGKITHKYAAEYDENGNIMKKTERTTDGLFSTFYQNGQEIKVESYDSEGNILWVCKNEYNEAGKPTKSTVYDADGIPTSVTTNEYDENGKVIKKTSYTQKVYNDELIKDELIKEYEVEYYKNGQMLKETEWRYDGSIKTVRDYNEAGKLTKSTSYGPDGIPKGGTTKEYDENGKVIKVTHYQRKAYSDELIKYYEVEYYKNGQVLKKTEWGCDGSIKYVHDYSDLKPQQ